MNWFRWLILVPLLTASLGYAAPIDKREVIERYDKFKQRYQTVKRTGVNLRSTDKLIKDIEKARTKKDYKALSTALAKGESALLPFEKTKSVSSNQPVSGKATSIVSNPDPIKMQRTVITSLSNNPLFRRLVSHKGNPRIIDDSGAVGRNIASFSDVGAQRDAFWVLALGIVEAQPAYFDKVIKAVEYASKKQDESGYFQNGLGVEPRRAINADTFFMQAFGQMSLIFREGSTDQAFSQRMENYLPMARKSTAWLRQNFDAMQLQDGNTPNRLVFDALAFQLNAKLLGDPSLIAIGNGFLQTVLSAQRSDGVFPEKGGHDSSYQAVTLMNLQIAWTYSDDPAFRQKMFQSIQLGIAWLKTRILPTGEVSSEGNTRTGLGQEISFGKAKDINYTEVAYCLYYWSVIAGDAESMRLADSVMTFALNNY